MANSQIPQVFKMKNKVEKPKVISKEERELKFLMQNLKTSIYNLYGKVIQDGKMTVDGKTIDFKDVVLEGKAEKAKNSHCIEVQMEFLKKFICFLYGKKIQDGTMTVDGKTIDFKDIVLERKDQKDETYSDCLRIRTTQRQRSEFTEEEYTRRLASVGLVSEFKTKTEKKESENLNLEQMVLELKDKVEKQEKRIKELEEARKRENVPSDQTSDPSNSRPDSQKTEAAAGPEQAVNNESDDQISDISIVSQDGDSSVGSDVDCLEDDLDEAMQNS